MKKSSLRNMFGFSIAIIVLVAGLLITDLFNLIARLEKSFKFGTLYILRGSYLFSILCISCANMLHGAVLLFRIANICLFTQRPY